MRRSAREIIEYNEVISLTFLPCYVFFFVTEIIWFIYNKISKKQILSPLGYLIELEFSYDNLKLIDYILIDKKPRTLLVSLFTLGIIYTFAITFSSIKTVPSISLLYKHSTTSSIETMAAVSNPYNSFTSSSAHLSPLPFS